MPGIGGLTIIPDGLSFTVWELLINHPAVQRGLMNSMLITGVGTVLNVIFTALMAWALSRPRLSGRLMILITIAPVQMIYPLILKFFTKGTLSGAVK